ncbi:hypothetical protein [Acrocarpospora catenulata]|uniref:hypothetical protein n=1 Tax=Acrocarpospora catenulata TaxID=2836182 RepID=UPI0027E02AB9|nr:hypothetical protein [Acrocarpospora catenulata]
MLEFAGIFDIHLTVAGDGDLDALAACAAPGHVKFTHIVLAAGATPSQPMLTLTGRGTLSEQRVLVDGWTARLAAEGHRVIRAKIEAAPWNADIPQDSGIDGCYFEHHVKVLVKDDLADLTETAGRHGAHVSANARRSRTDGSHEWFVTQRCHRVGLTEARRRLDALLADLRGFTVLEAEQEFVVYDDNPGADRGWIEER